LIGKRIGETDLQYQRFRVTKIHRTYRLAYQHVYQRCRGYIVMHTGIHKCMRYQGLTFTQIHSAHRAYIQNVQHGTQDTVAQRHTSRNTEIQCDNIDTQDKG
jgi:hypothetical protein